jgi:hypothetical protein
VAEASCVPVPFAPVKIKNANVSLPIGAPKESVQFRTLLAVTHKLEVELTSKFVSLPPLTLSSTEDALGETNCGYRTRPDDCDDEVGIEMTTLPDTDLDWVFAVLAGTLLEPPPPPQPASRKSASASASVVDRFIVGISPVRRTCPVFATASAMLRARSP